MERERDRAEQQLPRSVGFGEGRNNCSEQRFLSGEMKVF